MAAALNSGSDPYFAPRDRLDHSAELELRTLQRGSLTVAQYQRALPNLGVTAPNLVSDSYMAVVKLTDFQPHTIWRDDRPLRRPSLRRGSLSIFDFRRTWVAELRDPFHTVNFFVPQSALDEVAEDFRSPRLETMSLGIMQEHMDEVMVHLALALLPTLDQPHKASRLFADHIAQAVAVHLARTYGGLRARASNLRRGGLAPWQERRAKEMMAADLRSEVSLADLASACGLSIGHFSRSFKQLTGLPPHRWLLDQRVARAKVLLVDPRRTLRDIASTCGFADQSHLSRVFSRMMGVTPGIWRRQNLKRY